MCRSESSCIQLVAMNILALDLATKTGYAAHLPGGIISGSKSFKALPSQPVGALFSKWDEWINCQLDKTEIEFVAYELVDFRMQNRQWNQIYHGMVAIMMAAAFRRTIGTRGYTVRDIKLAATGKAKATKAEMVAAARAQWLDQAIQDDNQADALWVLYLACKSQGIEQKRHSGELF